MSPRSDSANDAQDIREKLGPRRSLGPERERDRHVRSESLVPLVLDLSNWSALG